MKSRSLLFVVSLALLLPACQSEISDKPAAQVSDTSASPSSTETLSTAPAAGTTSANVIKEKSRIDFVGAKVTRDHKGGFRNFDGAIEYAGGQPQSINFTIDLNSIYTDTEKLTGHLKSPDFFDTATYPTAKFTSTSLTSGGGPGTPADTTHMLKGTLDLHGVQKEVTIPVKAQTTAEGVRATSEFTINRHDWGISYRGAADDLIKDNVLIKLDLMFPPPPAS